MRKTMENMMEGDKEGREEAGEEDEEREVYIAGAEEAGAHSGRHDPGQSETGRRWTTALLDFHPSETFALYGSAQVLLSF